MKKNWIKIALKKRFPNIFVLVFNPYFTFLAHILEIVNKINLGFQNEKRNIHLLNAIICNLNRTILKNYIKKEYLDKKSIKNIDPKHPGIFVKLVKIILGLKLPIYLLKKVGNWRRMN